MYYCNNCKKIFENLKEFTVKPSSLHHYINKEDKTYQLCPHCDSENIKLESQMSEEEKLMILREMKFSRLVDDKGNQLFILDENGENIN